MGAKCCAPSSCKVRQRLLDEYESHEVYVPSRSASQDPDVALSRRRDSTVRVSVRSEGAANGQMKASNSTAGVSLTLPRVKNHTIRSTDTVPIVRVDRPPSRVETSHVVTGSLTRQLNDVSGKSVVRDSKSGQTMAANRSGSQPPGKVTYQYKKREQLETWESKKRVPSSNGTAIVTMVRKTKSLQEQDDILAKKRPEKSSKKPGNPNNH
uniref:P17/29C-like protein DDB_G0287399 n=1 Tax=Caenorhabditis tropicalis TaxID=1561998 RepID=A0A1I7UAW9_9PELO